MLILLVNAMTGGGVFSIERNEVEYVLGAGDWFVCFLSVVLMNLIPV